MENKKQFGITDNVKVLVNGKYWMMGEIIDMVDDKEVAIVVIPVHLNRVVDYIAVESKLDDLREVEKELLEFKGKVGFRYGFTLEDE